MAKRFVFNETSYHGQGAIHDIPCEVKKRGYKHAFIVTDSDLFKTKLADKLLDILDKYNLSYTLFSEIKSNPTTENVKAGLSAFKSSGADYIIALGGGSSIDAGKAISIIATNPEYSDVLSLEGLNNTKNKCIPIFAVPTTAGTGAEVTVYYVLKDSDTERKFVCMDPCNIPEVSFVDPEMMCSMPKELLASCGMDALTHAIEGYISKSSTVFSDMFCLKATELIFSSLEKAYNGDKDAFPNLALGQYLAGMGFSNSGLGLVHSMSHAITSFYKIPHGVANAVILPSVLDFNKDFAKEKYLNLARALSIKNSDSLSYEEASVLITEKIRNLTSYLSIPKNFQDILAEEDILTLSEHTLNDPCIKDNIKPVTLKEIQKLFLDLL